MLNGIHVIKGRWKLVKKIGQGAFGEIYQAKNVANNEDVAIKVERVDSKKQVLKLEVAVLKKLQECPCVCRFITCGRFNDINYMVMELLGENLSELRRRQLDGKFSLPTTLRLGQQMLKAIEAIHELGYLHRDIKPSNFAMGLASKKRIAFLIDFGLARRFVLMNNEVRPPRDATGFRGTARYASIHSHLSKDLGRRDDLWSLFYVLVEFAKGSLPWRKLKDKDQIGEMKIQYNTSELVSELPSEFLAFMQHLQALEYGDRPDYNHLQGLLKDMLGRTGATDRTPFDWELASANNVPSLPYSDSGNMSSTGTNPGMSSPHPSKSRGTSNFNSAAPNPGSSKQAGKTPVQHHGNNNNNNTASSSSSTKPISPRSNGSQSQLKFPVKKEGNFSEHNQQHNGKDVLLSKREGKEGNGAKGDKQQQQQRTMSEKFITPVLLRSTFSDSSRLRSTLGRYTISSRTQGINNFPDRTSSPILPPGSPTKQQAYYVSSNMDAPQQHKQHRRCSSLPVSLSEYPKLTEMYDQHRNNNNNNNNPTSKPNFQANAVDAHQRRSSVSSSNTASESDHSSGSSPKSPSRVRSDGGSQNDSNGIIRPKKKENGTGFVEVLEIVDSNDSNGHVSKQKPLPDIPSNNGKPQVKGKHPNSASPTGKHRKKNEGCCSKGCSIQ